MDSTITIVQGMRGMGKTNYLKNRLRDASPLFIVDIRNEYKHLQAFTKFNDFICFVLAHGNTISPNGQKLQYRFTFNTRPEYVRLFHILCGLKNSTLLIDEADALFTDRKMGDVLTDIFLGSRNNNVSIFFAGKRPFLIPILVRSQADEFIVFCTEEERDVKYLEKRLRVSLPKDPFNLKKGEAIIVQPGQTPALVQIPLFEVKSNGR